MVVVSVAAGVHCALPLLVCACVIHTVVWHEPTVVSTLFHIQWRAWLQQSIPYPLRGETNNGLLRSFQKLQ